MKKIIASILLILEILSLGISPISAITTDGFASPWTREKAAHLASAVLLYADPQVIDTLYAAGSATSAINILFPDKIGPDRTEYNSFVSNYTSSGFNWGDGNHAIRLYQIMYATDPYEAKRKLFSLFEDIFSVNIDSGRNIAYKDIYDQHNLIYDNMLGNYENLVKKLLYNNGQTGDFTEGAFLDLFNQENPNNPNENYARELLQLFLMGEYKPGEGKENNDIRNYEESDVKSLARILTGLNSDPLTHAITFDPTSHYSGTGILFLSGALGNTNFGFYDSNSGTVNPVLMRESMNGNNGITDNTIEYIFAKRSHEIALFLADRIYRFYIDDHPTRQQLDQIAGMIESNNFDILSSVKQILALDMMYSDISMNQIRYKNPLELGIGTLKLFHGNRPSEVVLDQNLYDTSLLRRLGWTPYYPGSVFGRDGFDDSLKWTSTSNQNAWMTATNYFTYRTSGSGVVDFRTLLGNYRKEVTNEMIPVMTSTKNTFTGSLTIIGGTLDTNIPVQGAFAVVQLLENIDPTNTGAILDKTGATESGTILDTTGSIIENNTGTVDTGSGVIEEIVTTTGTTEGTGTTDTGSLVVDTGSVIPDATTIPPQEVTTSEKPIVDSGASSTGEVLIETISLNAAPELGGSGTILTFSSGSVTLPNFQIMSEYGSITVYSGVYNGATKTLLISSGSLSNSGMLTPIYSGSVLFAGTSMLTADIISSDTLIDIYEGYIFPGRHLGTDTRSIIKQFLETEGSGSMIPVTPSSQEYYNRNIRGLISILLSEPEYVLSRGSDLPTVTETNEQRFLDNITGKIFFVELYGGNDYLSSIIPKDEYNTYLDYRTNQSGSIAITGNGLVDIGDFYMNSALAYGSGGAPGFKSLYDGGYLKIFNRVGAYAHSQDHDAAAKQITSYSNTTAASAEGVFGHLVNQEFESSHTISLGAKIPNIYRGGHYVNMGGNVMLSNPLNSSQTYHMSILSEIAKTRQYPGNTKNLFKNAGRISDIAKISVAEGGPSGANGDMNNIFNFSKILMKNGIGRSYYMGGYGGYDTHGDQFGGLNRNLAFVGESITKFFNEVKDTEDVTIVIFSEFGRTNKVNGSLGTDHGIGGGMMVVTSNQNLRNMLQNGTYGNMSIKNAKSNALGVGVDYRSVYGSIFKGLYNLDGPTFFGDSTISLADDISTDPNEISLLSYSYQASGGNITLNGELRVQGRNYNTGKAGYTRLLSGTGTNALKNTNLKEVRTGTGIYGYTFRLSSSSQPYFTLDSFSNQYTQTTIGGMLTGATVPRVLSNTTRTISQTGSSILPIFQGSSAPSNLSGSGLILNNSLSGTTLSIPGNTMEILFSSGMTSVTDLTSSSGTMTWNGGFILSELINRDYFIPSDALIDTDGTRVDRSRVARLIKIGADKLGVGMKLNQNIILRFTSVPTSDPYRVISSEDGIHWSDVEMLGKEYTRDQSGTISVSTNHLSYFALLSNTATLPPPSCTLSITPTTLYNGSTGLLSWNIMNTGTGILTPSNTILSGSGNMSIIPPSDTTTNYVLNVTNPSGNATCSTQVTTTPAPSTPIVGGSLGPGGPGSPAPSLDVCPDGDLSGNQYDGTCEPGIISTGSGNMSYKKEVKMTEKVKEKKKITSPSFGEKEVAGEPTEQASSLPKYFYVAAEHALTLRKKPYVSLTTVLSYLRRNTRVTVLEELDGWMKVGIDGVEGFVRSSYLRAENPADIIRSGGASEGYVLRGVVHVEVSGFVHRNPQFSSRIIAILHRDESVLILDELPNWYEIQLGDGSLGYIGKSLIKTSTEINTNKRVLK